MQKILLFPVKEKSHAMSPVYIKILLPHQTRAGSSHLDYSRKDRSALADLASVVQGITLLSYLIQSLLLKVTACFPPALQQRRHGGGRG